MLETKAVFDRKINDLEAQDCVIEEVIRLPGAEFDRFSKNMLRDWDFIRDNPIGRAVDEDERYHCLLIVGEGRRDGILVNPEGASYARYSALLPNADTFLMTARYPSLTELVRNLTAAADHIVALGSEPFPEGTSVGDPNKYSVQFEYLSKMFGIPLGDYGGMTDTLCAMLHDRPEIAWASFNNDELLVDLAPDGIDKDMHAPPKAPERHGGKPSVLKQLLDARLNPPPRKSNPDKHKKDAER